MISFKNSCAFWYNMSISIIFLMLFYYEILDLFVKNLNYNKEDKKVQYIRTNERLVNLECQAKFFSSYSNSLNFLKKEVMLFIK